MILEKSLTFFSLPNDTPSFHALYSPSNLLVLSVLLLINGRGGSKRYGGWLVEAHEIPLKWNYNYVVNNDGKIITIKIIIIMKGTRIWKEQIIYCQNKNVYLPLYTKHLLMATPHPFPHASNLAHWIVLFVWLNRSFVKNPQLNVRIIFLCWKIFLFIINMSFEIQIHNLHNCFSHSQKFEKCDGEFRTAEGNRVFIFGKYIQCHTLYVEYSFPLHSIAE